MTETERLQKAIRDLHGLESEYIKSVPVREIFQGKTVWEGDVRVFRVRGDPERGQAYGWSYSGEAGETRYLAVLGVSPIDSAQKAVQAAVMAHIEKQHRQRD